jgi:hypothetical protein
MLFVALEALILHRLQSLLPHITVVTMLVFHLVLLVLDLGVLLALLFLSYLLVLYLVKGAFVQSVYSVPRLFLQPLPSFKISIEGKTRHNRGSTLFSSRLSSHPLVEEKAWGRRDY